jgi:hypothetical protein
MSKSDHSIHITLQAGRIVCLLQAITELLPDDKNTAAVGVKTIADTAIELAWDLMLRLGDHDVKMLGEERP